MTLGELFQVYHGTFIVRKSGHIKVLNSELGRFLSTQVSCIESEPWGITIYLVDDDDDALL